MTYLSDKVITEVKDIFDKFTATDEVHELYEAKLKADHDAASEREYMINQATRKGLKKGMKKGIEKGMKKGIEQGIAQGREEGKMQDVINMIKLGFNNSIISQITHLSAEQIDTIRHNK